MSQASSPNPLSVWKLQLLGGIRLWHGGGEVRLPRLAVAVLTYLALEGTTPKYRLAGWLWPDSSEEAVKANMRKLLQRLRNSTKTDLVVGDERIELSDLVEVDAVQLSAFSFAGDYARVAASEGALLEGLEFDDCPEFDEWLLATRESFDALRRDASAAEAERLEQAGEYAQALGFARRSLELDPVSEEAHRRLMRLHYRLGDRGAALAAFERCKKILEREFASAPLPETLELARQIEHGTLEGGKHLATQPSDIPTPSALAQTAGLMGRAREWAMMEQAYQEGKLVFLRGEPGVGKTRLAMEFAASKGAVWLIAPRPGDHRVPFSTYARTIRQSLQQCPELLDQMAPWVKLEISRLVPEIAVGDTPPPLVSEADKLRLLEALTQFSLLTNDRSRIIVGDDAQYMDGATVEANVYQLSKFGSVGQGSTIPFTIEIYRKGELDPEIEQKVVFALVEANLAVLIDVEPLSREAVGQMLEGLAIPGSEGLAHQLTRFTGGNPLFVLETVRHLQETGQLERGWPGRLPPPGKVGTVINQRLSKLSSQAQNVARAAAILQSDFNLSLIARVLEMRPLELMEPWQELETAQVLQGNAFSHDLIYETVRAGITPAVGAILHGRAAEVLGETGANPARIALHWMEAGEAFKAAPLWLEAAEQAHQAYRGLEAAGFLEQAVLAYEQAGDQAQAFQARIWAVESLWRHDSGPRQVKLIDGLMQTARTPEQKGEAWSAKAWWAISINRDQEAEEAARRGLSELGNLEAYPETAGKLLRALCDALNNQGRYEQALQTLEQANRLLEAIHDQIGLFFNALNYSNVLFHLHRHAEVIAHNQRLIASLPAETSRVWQAEALRRIASSQFFLAQYQDALENARNAETLLEGIEGVEHTRYEIVMEQGWACFSQERHTEALGAFRQAEALLGPHESRVLLIEPYSTIYRVLGAWEQLEQALQAAEQEIQNHTFYRDLVDYHRVLYLYARGLASEGDFAETERRLELAGWDHGLARMRLERALLVEPAQGLLLAQKSLDWARLKGIPGLETEALAHTALLLYKLGRLDEALDHTEAALNRLADYPPPAKRALVWLAGYEVRSATASAGAFEALQKGIQWVNHVAENHVPEEFREGYRWRNPIHRGILEFARLEKLV